MAEENKFRHGRAAEKNTETPQKGVGTGLLIALIIVALIVGGVFGYLMGSRYSTAEIKLREAEDKIAEYELMMAELYSSGVDYTVEEETEDTTEDEGHIAVELSEDAETVTEEAPETLIVAKFNGGEVYSEEALVKYDELVSDAAFAGDATDDKNAVLTEAITQLVKEKVVYAKAAELGYTSYSDEDETAIEAQAQQEYENMVNVFGEDAATGEYSLESITADIRANYWQTKMFDDITKDATVSADAINDKYDSLLEEQSKTFEEDHARFEEALATGETVVYYPSGYRSCRVVAFTLDEESAMRAFEIEQELADADEEKAAELMSEYDALFTDLMAQADEFCGKVKAGTDFDAAAAEMEIPLDSAMISGDSIGTYGEAFVEAAMALELPGDSTEPVRTNEGVYVIRYASDIEAGSIPLSDVSAMLTNQLKDEVKQQAYDEQVEAWVSETAPEYHPEYIIDQVE